SQPIHVLSKLWKPVACWTMTGAPHVRPPSVDRLTVMASPPNPPLAMESSVRMIHTWWLPSYATAGSVARSYGPAGVAYLVRLGRPPSDHVAPLSVEVANPMFEAPPSVNRPIWKAD